MDTYHYVKLILWQPEGPAYAPLNPAVQATMDDPRVVVLERGPSEYRPTGDGDLIGGRVREEIGESPLKAVAREMGEEAGLGVADLVERLRVVYGDTVDNKRGDEDVSVTHTFYLARLAADAVIDQACFGPNADNRGWQWRPLSQAAGAISIPSQKNALERVQTKRLWLPKSAR